MKKAAKGMKINGYEIAKTFAKGVKDDTTGDTQVIHVVKLAQPVVAYEAAVEKGGQKGEVAVDADGKVLEMPAWAKAKPAKADSEDKD